MNRMSAIEFAIEYLGEDVAGYLKHKHTGGSSNEKGANYECFFATFKASEAIGAYLKDNDLDSTLVAQEMCFVDDLQIDLNDTRSNYQLKNSSDVKWGNADNVRSIQCDFSHQYDLNTHLRLNTQLYLVCSNKEKVMKLNDGIPETIANYSKALYFPYMPINRLLQESPEFRVAIENITSINDLDKLESVATQVLGIWINSDEPMQASQLYQRLKTQVPSYTRPIDINIQLKDDVKRILDNISEFNYHITYGFFNWSYSNEMDSGMLPYDCHDQKFKKFESQILKMNPQSFDDLEGLLL